MPGKVFFERPTRQPKNKTPPDYKPNGVLLYIVIDLSGFGNRPDGFGTQTCQVLKTDLMGLGPRPVRF